MYPGLGSRPVQWQSGPSFLGKGGRLCRTTGSQNPQAHPRFMSGLGGYLPSLGPGQLAGQCLGPYVGLLVPASEYRLATSPPYAHPRLQVVCKIQKRKTSWLLAGWLAGSRNVATKRKVEGGKGTGNKKQRSIQHARPSEGRRIF